MRSFLLPLIFCTFVATAAAQPRVVVKQDATRGHVSISAEGQVLLADEDFVTKYDDELNEIWSVPVHDDAKRISAGNDGVSYAFGGETNTILNADGTIRGTFAHGITILALRAAPTGPIYATGMSSSDLWVGKLTAEGEEVWSHKIPFSRRLGYWDGVTSKLSLDIDAAGHLYIAGSFAGTLELGGSHTLQAAGGNDIFLAKYDTRGTILHAFALGSDGEDFAYDFLVDAEGNSHIAGYFDRALDFDPSSSTAVLESPGCFDAFLASYDADGNYRWAADMGGPGVCAEAAAFDLTTNSKGGLFVTGYFFDHGGFSVDFDAGSGVVTAPYEGEEDAFMVRYSTSGNFEWVESLGSRNGDTGLAIEADANGNLYLLGSAGAPLDLNAGPSSGETTVEGLFLAKYEESGRLATHVDRPVDRRQHSLAIYPNPFSDVLKLELPQSCSGALQIDLLDAIGRRVGGVREEVHAGGTSQISLHISDVASGLYLLHVRGDNCNLSEVVVRRR